MSNNGLTEDELRQLERVFYDDGLAFPKAAALFVSTNAPDAARDALARYANPSADLDVVESAPSFDLLPKEEPA